MIEQSAILEAYQFRHACKRFDADKKIDPAEFDFIMETARLSPSSFGMEPWRFLVITNDEVKAKVKPACWNQAQIDTCSHLVVVLTKTAAVQDDAYITAMFSRRPIDDEAKKNYIQKFKEYLKEKIMGFAVRYLYKKSLRTTAEHEWCARQTYIAASSMTTSAAMRGIDSCYIEGFKKEDVEKILEIDTPNEEVALVLTFGYRVNEPKEKFRLSMDEIREDIV